MWMTVHEASIKWKLSQRTVQHLCKEGKVLGAVHFNRTWAIPIESQRPGKLPVSEKSQSLEQGYLQPKHLLDFKTLEAILEQCPYSLNVTRVDGTMVFANSRFMEGVIEEVRNNAIGNYNILTEPNMDVWGLKAHVTKAFEGERITTKMLKFPNKELIDIRYGKEYAFVNLYQDITSFPVFDESGILSHVVTLFVPSEKHFERTEIMAAKAYIDTHWVEPLTINSIAKHVNLSVSRLTSVFKAETSLTLHDYYNDTKMRHVCELLTRPDLMIYEVFNKCGIAYNSHYSSLFKACTGMTPRQYRLNKKCFE